MAKLTPSVDSQVVENGKVYAKQRGVSISALVEAYLASVAEPPPSSTAATPILNSVRRVLKGADVEGYRHHLTAKYR
jgi:Family of unknown function (DUF6364)